MKGCGKTAALFFYFGCFKNASDSGNNFKQPDIFLALSNFNLSVNNVLCRKTIIFVRDGPGIDFYAALFYQAADFSFAGAPADFDYGVQNADAVGRLLFDKRQFSADTALFKSFDGRIAGCFGFGLAAADFGCLKSQNLFGFVYFLIL